MESTGDSKGITEDIKIDFNKMTREEKEKFFEEHYSPLIRYGFGEACNEIMEYITKNDKANSDGKLVVELAPLQDKLLEMISNKRKVNQVELLKAFVEAKAEKQ